jgi:CelD/BcsL family acetyltransferase involved in cellulose biosynthesis
MSSIATSRGFANPLPASRAKSSRLALVADRATPVLQIDPLVDGRWSDLVARHAEATVFHSAQWLEALACTYSYKPLVFTTAEAGEPLQNGLPVCEVASWLTGRRLVSLPFSDHCTPLLRNKSDLQILVKSLEDQVAKEGWSYYELRSLSAQSIASSLPRTSVTYSFHQLDLTDDLATIFQNLHKGSIQRKIRRAEREGLRYEEGSSQRLLNQFYKLFTTTRGRHGVPPQPKAWFRNLVLCFGEALKIRVAYKEDRAIAAMLTLRHKDTLVYKYGGSDAQFHNLGGVPMLFWQAIQDAKRSGLHSFDFGRTDAGQNSLVIFKNRWGAQQSQLTYVRYGKESDSTHAFDLPSQSRTAAIGKKLCRRLPSQVLAAVGGMLYRHVG